MIWWSGRRRVWLPHDFDLKPILMNDQNRISLAFVWLLFGDVDGARDIHTKCKPFGYGPVTLPPPLLSYCFTTQTHSTVQANNMGLMIFVYGIFNLIQCARTAQSTHIAR